MLHRHPASVFALLACVGVLSGCSKSSPTQPIETLSRDDADDIVQQVAVTSIATDWGSYLLSGNTPPAPGTTTTRRLRPARLGRTADWDTTYTQGGLSFTFYFAFFDAAQNAQPDFNPSTTWIVEEDSEISGTIDLPNFDSAVWHLGNLEFIGTRTSDDTLRFAGTSRDTAFSHFTAALRPVERWFHVDLVRTIEGVRVLKTAGSYPHAGTIRWIITATRLRSASRADVEATLDVDAVLTFNGTRYPTLSITGGWTYTVDLETGAIARP